MHVRIHACMNKGLVDKSMSVLTLIHEDMDTYIHGYMDGYMTTRMNGLMLIYMTGQTEM